MTTDPIVGHCPAHQQPQWPDPAQVRRVRDILATRPPLVRAEDVLILKELLARVAVGECLVMQAGDCAEDPAECTAEHVRRKISLLHLLAATVEMSEHRPVLRVGRIAGQFAKPRSRPTERVGDRELPVYRGHMVNDPAPDPEARTPDPLRLLTGFMASIDVMEHLGWRGSTGPRLLPHGAPVMWTSHEALLLDYEVPMIRHDHAGRRWLGSTHWPWIGDRTRQPDGAHVALLAGMLNPVACKLGPDATPDDVYALGERLDPHREPGRLTFIARMGADRVADRLPPLVEAAHAAGHPVIWLCDPMHGNTVIAPDGRKIRYLDAIAEEVRQFRQLVMEAGGVAGGLHLETTPENVTECIDDETGLTASGGRYTTLCDPRLNPRQAVEVVSAWTRRPERVR